MPLPLVSVSTGLEGIRPTDAERLLSEPMERGFGAIEGLREMRSEADEGVAFVRLEFQAGVTSTLPWTRSAIRPAASRASYPRTPTTSP